jgi:ribosome biogenesis GTPase
MTNDLPGLAAFGWSPFFQRQLAPSDIDTLMPVRVLAVHRNGLDASGTAFRGRVATLPPARDDDETQVAVGDWLLVDRDSLAPVRLLDRKSLFKRKAAGTGQRIQVIAANVDTLLVVTSCNQDFNVARLERYLALAREAGVVPVIVITKADLADDTGIYRSAAERLMAGLPVECLDARDPEAVAVLSAWCAPGQTVALVGSSGVGKSTLVNTLTGGTTQATAGIREDDARGRHTTTGRSMHPLAAGGWLLDTSGMRELQLADAAAGVDSVFADIAALASRCRFSDCAHDSEPGCAVQAALADGSIDPARLVRYRKLAREEARNSEALHERHARARAFGKMTRGIMKAKRERWDG